jgi:hypothetical protein
MDRAAVLAVAVVLAVIYLLVRFVVWASRHWRDLPIRLPTAPPEREKPPEIEGFGRHRHGDSNPGFRRERAAS